MKTTGEELCVLRKANELLGAQEKETQKSVEDKYHTK